MAKRKWKRIEPGRYQCGDLVIDGAGTQWQLLQDSSGEELGSFKSKKAAQEAAESCDTVPRKMPSAAAPAPSSVSEITYLRQEVASLAIAVTELSTYIKALGAELRAMHRAGLGIETE